MLSPWQMKAECPSTRHHDGMYLMSCNCDKKLCTPKETDLNSYLLAEKINGREKWFATHEYFPPPHRRMKTV